MTTEKKQDGPDWERIESDYRAGVLSVREIASVGGCTHGAIQKRAKKHGWTRDLSAKIKSKADDLVAKGVVASGVASEKAATDKVTVEANAQAIANVRLGHRKDLARFKSLAIKMLDELEVMTEDRPLFSELGDMLRSDDDRGQDRRNDIYQKVIALPGRIDAMRKLADVLKIVIALEREAYSIQQEAPKQDSNGDARYDGLPDHVISMLQRS